MKQKETNWEEIKGLYVASDRYTLAELAKKFQVSLASIKRHSSQGKWGKERQANIQKASAQIEKVQAEITKTELIEEFTYREKINEIANRLLNNISAATDMYGKPANIAALTIALKDLVAILRDVNAQPNLTMQRNYELAQRKIDIDEKRANRGLDDTDESGVVMLPEVQRENEFHAMKSAEADEIAAR